MCTCLKAVEGERDFTLRCLESANTNTLKFHLDSMLCGYRASIEAIINDQANEKPQPGEDVP